VLGVTAEDELALLLPKLEKRIHVSKDPQKKLEPPQRSLRKVIRNRRRKRHPKISGVKEAVNDVWMCQKIKKKSKGCNWGEQLPRMVKPMRGSAVCGVGVPRGRGFRSNTHLSGR
jgi:hypothetical protein